VKAQIARPQFRISDIGSLGGSMCPENVHVSQIPNHSTGAGGMAQVMEYDSTLA
jgi:hypothetical protein